MFGTTIGPLCPVGAVDRSKPPFCPQNDVPLFCWEYQHRQVSILGGKKGEQPNEQAWFYTD
jgi:hypothetical protein